MKAKAAERLIVLDGLRGVAILLVLLYHVWTCVTGLHVLQDDSLPLALLYAGNTGVTLFFLLSGFLVSRPFIEGAASGTIPPLRSYVQRRALRILPPYYVVALVGLLYTQQFDQLLPVLLFAAKSYDVGYFSVVWWSLSTEIQFYVLVPIFFLAILSPQRRMLGVLIGFLFCLLYICVVGKWIGGASFELKFRLILSVIGQMPAFLVGGLLALAWHRKHYRLNPLLSRVALVGLLLLLACVLRPAAQMGTIHYIWSAPWYVLPEALVWGGITWVLLMTKHTGFSVLNNRLTRYFGRISFSLYLVHMPIIQQIQERAGTLELWVSVPLALVLSIALAQLMYLLIEQPFSRLKKQSMSSQSLLGTKT